MTLEIVFNGFQKFGNTEFDMLQTKKPAAETEETPAEDKTEESKEEKPKKKCWWRRECGEKTEEEQKGEHMIIGMNLIDRDEKVRYWF